MTPMDTLEKIFGSAAKVKMMRLFLFNPSDIFDAAGIRLRAKVNAPTVRSLINTFEKIDLVKKKSFVKTVQTNGKLKKKKSKGWILNSNFEYIKQLQDFLIEMSPVKDSDVVERLKPAGAVKFLVLSGVFIQNSESRIDLLIVGDKLKPRIIRNVVEMLEAEIGKELRFASFPTNDFKYRLSMCDKLVRDILDFPHTVVVDKLQIS